MPPPLSEAAPPYRLIYAPQRDDVASFLLMPREVPMRRKWLFIGLLIACGMAAPILLDAFGVSEEVQDSGWTRLLAAIGIALAGWLVHTIVTSIGMTRRLRRLPAQMPEQTVTADEDSVTVETEAGVQSHRWADIGQVTRSADRVYICPDRDTAIIVPCRAFADRDDFNTFAAWSLEVFRRSGDDESATPA